ncbi:MAG: hypothetical protein OET79_01130 [Nitrospirota bacterium]|nr:hypothetical protein [Nitrospirota bacterium]
MWFGSTFTERQSISKRKEGYNGRQRRKKGQRQSSKTKSQPTEKKGKKEIAKALYSMEVVGFALAKPTIPEALNTC